MTDRLGVLGGMGPQATNTFYQFIIDRTDARTDQEHVNALILSDSQMPDRTAAILGSEEDRDRVFQRLLAEAIDAEDKEACNAQFAEILAEQTALKKQKEEILQSSADTDRVCTRMKQAAQAVENTAQTITEWNENAVRQIVERVTVLSADEVLVRIKSGAEIKQRLER